MGVHLAKGCRDFLPQQMSRRLHVIDTLRDVFTRFGFEPLETPALERIGTLTGKYGDEGDKLMFRILKRGEGASRGETDMGLRYDLTVPLARVMAMNPGLTTPFKRYQIQPVWRAERPQRGRFREFWQCDVDVVGCADRAADAECVAVAEAGLVALGFDAFTIRVNHRAVLRDIVTAAGAAEHEVSVLVAIDKLDKIGRDGVDAELLDRGLTREQADVIWGLLEARGEEALDHLEAELGEDGRQGVAELRQLIELAHAMGVDEAHLAFDPTLARGLDYYTGPVFEATLDDADMGSVAGGGRYDGLIGLFSGRKDVPAVGVSLGIERLIVVMEERGMFGEEVGTTRVLITAFDKKRRPHAFMAARAFREAGVPTQVTLDRVGKLGKQFRHADRIGAGWVVVIGPGEVSDGVVALKNLRTGEQEKMPLVEAARKVADAELG